MKEEGEKHSEQSPVTLTLCEAYRQVLENQIAGLKDDIKKVDRRLWATLSGIIISILLTALGVVVAYLT